MSTPVDLDDEGKLHRFDPALGPGILESRTIFLHPRVTKQIIERVSGTASDRQIEIKPEEQLDALLADFCEGFELDAETQFKKLTPKGQGIWELKTADLRLFGWFYAKDCFIWSSVDAKWKLLQTPGLVTGYVNQAVHDRLSLFGPTPTFVASDDPNDVISN